MWLILENNKLSQLSEKKIPIEIAERFEKYDEKKNSFLHPSTTSFIQKKETFHDSLRCKNCQNK